MINNKNKKNQCDRQRRQQIKLLYYQEILLIEYTSDAVLRILKLKIKFFFAILQQKLF